MIVESGSLFDARGEGTILAAVGWIEGTLLGTLATIIAILAVAGIGLLMLQGRFALRQGARVLLGCFILFGAGSIAAGIRSLADDTFGPQILTAEPAAPPPIPLPTPDEAPVYDPYAGASVPDR